MARLNIDMKALGFLNPSRANKYPRFLQAALYRSDKGHRNPATGPISPDWPWLVRFPCRRYRERILKR